MAILIICSVALMVFYIVKFIKAICIAIKS